MRITVLEIQPACSLWVTPPASAARSIYVRFSRKSWDGWTAVLLIAAFCVPIYAQPPRGTFFNQDPQDLEMWAQLRSLPHRPGCSNQLLSAVEPGAVSEPAYRRSQPSRYRPGHVSESCRGDREHCRPV